MRQPVAVRADDLSDSAAGVEDDIANTFKVRHVASCGDLPRRQVQVPIMLQRGARKRLRRRSSQLLLRWTGESKCQ